MKLQQLRYFVAVYEAGSFSAAAARVNATQSGLSMHVSQMEKQYDVTLFVRNSSGVAPTETGNALYKEAVKVLTVASNAEDKLRYLSKAVVGHISVGLMPTFTRSVLTNVLLRFSEEYSEVRVTISEAYSGDLSEAVSAGKLDFAVVPSISQNKFITGTPMGRDQECFVCAAGSHPSVGPSVRLKDLPPQRIVVPSWMNTRRARIENYLAENGIEVREVLEIDTMYGTLDLVARSDWVSILPGILCVIDLDGTKRRVMPLNDPPLYVEYLRIEPQSKPLSRAAKAFADILQEELNEALEISLVSKQ